ncbi:HNH endonuclease [Candidatus Woesearchaeota archaeon]|nr:HNH endonuclease [Candidatus Woesearchaeota archaeon]
MKIKLTIELVPSTVWFSSLYNIFKNSSQQALWRDIKNMIFKKEGRKCWVCGRTDRRLEAHEFWDYDDKNKIQKLVAIHHLCDLCHKVKHIGLWLHTDKGARLLDQQGLDSFDVVNHFCAVNNCDQDVFDKCEEEAFKVFAERSKYQWKQDFDAYEKIIRPLIKNEY